MASNTILTNRTATFPGPPEAARQAVETAMVAHKGKLVDGDGDLTAKFGSQVMLRVVGGWLMPGKFFPVKATASFTPTDHGTAVAIQVADAMGIGVKAGMKGKYERAVNELADALVSAAA